MKAHDFSGTHKIDNAADLERIILTARFGDGRNEVLLWHDDHEYPVLSILLKDSLAALHYVPCDGDAGFASIAENLGLEPGEMTTFATGNIGEEIQVSNRAIVSLPTAAAVAREFFHSKELPRSVEWIKL